MISKNDVFVVIPAYNEGKQIERVLSKIIKHGFKNIILVDDCSTDNTAVQAAKTASGSKSSTITILKHSINRGAGAATKTGIDYAYTSGAKYVMTLDADGQHDIADAPNLLKVAQEYNVVIGSRLINPKGMPLTRQLINKVGSILTFFLYGIYVKDSQSGFKIFDRKAMKKIQIKFDRYEFCSEVLHEIKHHKLTYKEVPIKAIYTKYSLSKGQNFLNGFRMIYKMIMRFFLS